MKIDPEIYQARIALQRVRAWLQQKAIDEINWQRLARRLFKYVKADPLTESACWLWRGSVNSSGYPKMAFNHPSNAQGSKVMVSRIIWMLFNGGLAGGLLPGTHGEIWWVAHTCRNKRCVRPSHLRLEQRIKLPTEIRAAKNTAQKRKWRKKRNAVTHDQRVEKYRRQIEVKRQRAIKIIAMRKEGKSWLAIARATGATMYTIDHVLGGRAFKNLERPESYPRPATNKT